MPTKAQLADAALDSRLERAAKAYDAVGKLSRPVWVIVCLLVAGGFYVGQYVYKAQQLWAEGSPALKRLDVKMDQQIELLKADDRVWREQMGKIISEQQTTNALLTQRIEQVERQLGRK